MFQLEQKYLLTSCSQGIASALLSPVTADEVKHIRQIMLSCTLLLWKVCIHRLAMPVLAKERISNQVLHFSTGMTSSICENTASHSLEAAIHLEASCNSLTTAVSTKRLAKNLHGIWTV